MISNGSITIDSEEDEELWFKVEMTHRQFGALAHKLQNADLENEIINLEFFKNRLKKAKNLNLEEVEKWLKNSWNTEHVMLQNKTIIENTGQSFAMQWAFPQAYYATFASITAHYNALGYTEKSHTAVLKNFGALIEQGKFPQGISFYCCGGKTKIEYNNITKCDNISSMEYNINKPETIDNQICQFLKATREINLNDQARKNKFKNAKGLVRKKLNPQLWEIVSNSIGNTTLLDLLYRKRIKANYLDIDTFSSAHFRGLEMSDCLSTIIDRFNFVNECYIAKAIGFGELKNMLDRHLKTVNNETVKNRLDKVQSILNSF